MPKGVRRLSRRRYEETVRYLKSVIDDNAKPDRLRMQAVETLLSIYDRHDKTEARRLWPSAAGTAQQSSQEAQEPEETQPVRESIEEFLARVKAARSTGNTEDNNND